MHIYTDGGGGPGAIQEQSEDGQTTMMKPKLPMKLTPRIRSLDNKLCCNISA